MDPSNDPIIAPAELSAPITQPLNDRSDAPDADAELALQLHRQLNAPGRRSRHQADNATAPNKRGALHRLASSSRRGGKSHRPRRPPKELQPHEAAAEAAIRKAARSARRSNCVKAFCPGVPWGCALLRNTLQSRETLLEAAVKAFGRDGFACEVVDQLDIVVVTWDREAVHFPSTSTAAAAAAETAGGDEERRQQQQVSGGGGGGSDKDDDDNSDIDEDDDEEEPDWDETMAKAARLYLSISTSTSTSSFVAIETTAGNDGDGGGGGVKHE